MFCFTDIVGHITADSAYRAEISKKSAGGREKSGPDKDSARNTHEYKTCYIFNPFRRMRGSEALKTPE